MAADAVLLVAADIVGRGATAAVKAAYLRGWLEGFQSQLVVTPELTSVASRLEACLQAARIEAAWFMALLQHSRRHTATYSALASGFPPPLLLVGAPPSTRPSLVPGRPGEIHRTSLTAPWRLAMASDGLLQRLGSGSESRGVAALRGWLAGPARDRDPAVFLDAPDVQTDDELFAEIRWEGWDDVVQLVVEEHGSRHRALSLVETFVARLGGERAGRAAASAVAEAVDNAARHAYAGAGPVQLSMREEGDRVRVQIEDSGRADLGRTPGDGLKLMRHHATSVDRWYGKSGGTIVSLAFEKEPQDAEERNA